MADRYQDRPFPADHDDSGGYDRGVQPGKAESDPLAELARLIGQNDQFGNAGRAPHPLQRANVRAQEYQPPAEPDEEEAAAPAGPPPWMQRARQEAPQQDYEEPEQDFEPSPVHPLHRYAAQHAAAPEPEFEPEYQEEALEPSHEQDPSRYDEQLYGQIESGEQEFQRDPAYPDDPYAYQSGYEEEPEPRKRRSGLLTVAAVLALAVVGTGGALAYRTYVGSPRSGEPPIIKADNSPTKVVPAPADGAGKTPDRMVPGDGGEKLVSREETPVDVNSKAGGPRVVFPPLNQNANPPTVSSVTSSVPPSTAANGTMPNSEPRRISTLTIKGDAASAGVPAGATLPAKPAPTARAPATPPRGNPSAANASANAPLSLTPGAPAPDPAPAAPTRIASTNPAPAVGGGGGYLVQVSSQKNEADALSSYRALQGKYPSVLGSQTSVVKRVDLGEKGVYYRAFAGPFSSMDQATQICTNLKAAGGPQCLIQRN